LNECAGRKCGEKCLPNSRKKGDFLDSFYLLKMVDHGREIAPLFVSSSSSRIGFLHWVEEKQSGRHQHSERRFDKRETVMNGGKGPDVQLQAHPH